MGFVLPNRVSKFMPLLKSSNNCQKQKEIDAKKAEIASQQDELIKYLNGEELLVKRTNLLRG